MKHLTKILNISIKRIEDGDLETAKLAIKQVISELQNINSKDVPKTEEVVVEDNEKESFKNYFIKLIKDLVITERDEEITDEGEEPYIVKEYRKNGVIVMEYLIQEKKFYLHPRRMGIDTTSLNQKTDIELYGGNRKFDLIVKGILKDFYKVPIDEVRLF